jgi:hypothetical protein
MRARPGSYSKFQAFDGAVHAVKEKLCGLLQRRNPTDVCNGQVRQRMGVVFLTAVATSPLAIILFDDAEHPGHRASLDPATLLKDGSNVLIPTCPRPELPSWPFT